MLPWNCIQPHEYNVFSPMNAGRKDALIQGTGGADLRGRTVNTMLDGERNLLAHIPVLGMMRKSFATPFYNDQWT
jgi:hypothetical protein